MVIKITRIKYEEKTIWRVVCKFWRAMHGIQRENEKIINKRKVVDAKTKIIKPHTHT